MHQFECEMHYAVTSITKKYFNWWKLTRILNEIHWNLWGVVWVGILTIYQKNQGQWVSGEISAKLATQTKYHTNKTHINIIEAEQLQSIYYYFYNINQIYLLNLYFVINTKIF